MEVVKGCERDVGGSIAGREHSLQTIIERHVLNSLESIHFQLPH